MAEQTPNPSSAWDDFADSVVATDAERIEYWRNRAKVEGAQRFGAVYDHAAKRHKIARKTVAERMHTQPSAITRLFAGADANPTLDTMVGAALATGVKMTIVFEAADTDVCPLEIVENF